MALTADNARDIADGFLDAHRTIDEYLDEHWKTISRPDYETISESGRTLLRVSGFITTVAVGLSIEQMEDDAEELKKVIADAKDSLAHLQDIGKAIRVTAGMVELATGIMARNPRAVFKAAKGLSEVIEEA